MSRPTSRPCSRPACHISVGKLHRRVGAGGTCRRRVLTKLHAAIQTSLDDPQLVTRLNDLGLTVRKMSQAEFASFVQQQVQGWAEPVKASGAKLN